MGLLVAVMLGILLNLPQGLQSLDLDVSDVLHETHVTAVLGEEAYLSCLYTGKHTITVSSWNRIDSSRSSTKMAGFRYDGSAFSKDSFSTPASITNLTVKVNIESLDMEGEYTCLFSSDEEDRKESVFLTVIARPDISTRVGEEVVNMTQYQSVSCSAGHGKPLAAIRWETRDGAPAGHGFSIATTNSTHPNGTASIRSLLRFPILWNNETSVTCVVQHPALTEPSTTDVKLQTFEPPTVTMEMRLTQKEGEDVVEVACRVTGGRPRPDITWVLPNSAYAPQPQSCSEGLESGTSCCWFPPDLFEGENITCVFGYSLLPAAQIRTITLPTYYLTSLQLKSHSAEMSSENASSVLMLDEGDRDIVIALDVVGNAPRYDISCSKDGEPLPEGLDMVGTALSIEGPVDTSLAGRYHCQASYHKHTASLQLQIKVNPTILKPVSFPPNISVNLREEGDNIYIECLASDSAPAANVSWVLSQDLNSTVKSDITSCNGSHSVRSVLTLPACWPRDRTIQCVVEHPDLTDAERRKVVRPSCVRGGAVLTSHSVWENGVAYVVLECRAVGVTPHAAISWSTACKQTVNTLRLPEPQQGNGTEIRTTARVSVLSYTGCTVVCLLDQDGLMGQQQQRIDIPLIGRSEIHVSVGPHSDSTLWAAVCKYRGDAFKPNISWVISDHNTTTVGTSVPTYRGITVLLTSTYEFQLSQHEGKDLTCVIQNDYGKDMKKTLHVPKYFISSIVVLNNTKPLHGSREQRAIPQVTLQTALSPQTLAFRVHGNTPDYKFTCFRADGSPAHTVSTALFFPEPVSECDAGLYTCHASWNHHRASILVQVDVTSQENTILKFIVITFSSATAIILILIVPLTVFCKRSGGSNSTVKDRKKRESLAALMQDPRSPELKKSALCGGKAQECAEHYSIVIDVKSTV